MIEILQNLVSARNYFIWLGFFRSLQPIIHLCNFKKEYDLLKANTHREAVVVVVTTDPRKMDPYV